MVGSRGALVALMLVGVLALPAPAVPAAAGRHDLARLGPADFARWEHAGTRSEDAGLTLAGDGRLEGSDPYPPGSYRGGNYYNGGHFWFGEASSPPIEVTGGFEELIPSWIAETPPGTWIEVRAAVRLGDGWSPDYSLGIWALDEGTVRRHSVRDQADERVKVETDTLVLGRRAEAYRLRVVLFTAASEVAPRVRGVGAVASRTRDPRPPGAEAGVAAGVDLPVPERSQMIYPNGGEAWCSPTSTSMVMAFWAERTGQPDLNRPVPEAAAATFDWVYRGAGNWPFNTAYAGAHGLDGVIARFDSLAELEPWLAAGVPAVLSMAYAPGELANAPLARSSGHLLVLRGFTPEGDAIVNDPAGNPNLGQSVRRVYARAQLEAVWQKYSQGTVYLIAPRGWPTPSAG